MEETNKNNNESLVEKVKYTSLNGTAKNIHR